MGPRLWADGAWLRDGARAAELVQEVFRRAWQARDRYQENGAGRAYLLRIADRLVCDLGRKSGREVTLDECGWRELEPIGSGAEPSAMMQCCEAREALHAALDTLSPVQRRVLLLRYYGDLTFAEIAETLGSPLSTVLSHGRRGLLALRKVMTEDPS
jgi:RNA polymerase sigma-70 factor (ECF subfamily)